MKNMFVKNAVKTKTIIAMLAFGASALAVNESFGDNLDGPGLKNDHLPSSLSQTIKLNQDSKLKSISTLPKLMTVSTVPGLITIPTVRGFITIPAASESRTTSGLFERMAVSGAARGHMTTSELHELMTISDVHELTTISGDAPGRMTTSNPHNPTTVSDTTESAAISAVPEPTTIFAGALLLLPLSVSVVRNLRRNKKRDNQNG
jgi:hypothetical protein